VTFRGSRSKRDDGACRFILALTRATTKAGELSGGPCSRVEGLEARVSSPDVVCAEGGSGPVRFAGWDHDESRSGARYAASAIHPRVATEESKAARLRSGSSS